MIVVEDWEVNKDMVLGTDALNEGKAIINFQRKELVWYGQTFSINSNDAHYCPKSYGFDLAPPEIADPKIEKLVRDNEDLFADRMEPVQTSNLPPLTITTEGPPIAQKAYRMPLTKRKVVEEEISKMLADGIIEHSSSPWSSPIALVPKKDGTTRFCVDYRKLNEITVRDQYPLPPIRDILDQLGGAGVYSTLDLKTGFWQLPVHPADIPKTAFRCHLGHFQFVRMLFGLANAPAAFQRAMDQVMKGLIGFCVFVYLDDIVVFSKDMDAHAEHLELVFDRLREAGLRLKPSKCSFAKTEIKLLGYIISKNGITSDPEKVEAIANLKPPETKREVKSFLGMAGYYRQCVPDYAKHAAPLVKLTRNNQTWEWSEEQQNAFDTLKNLWCSQYVLAHPDPSKPYKLYTDASGYALGAILVQDQEGQEKVIQYLSHQLSGPQLNYATIEKEALAVIYAITKLRPYLYGAKFTVYTDHKPLTSLFTKDMVNTKIQ